MVMSVPTFGLANVKVGGPTKLTSSPASTPESDGVPDAVPTVLPSYTLSSPVRPVIVNGIGGFTVIVKFWLSPAQDPFSGVTIMFAVTGDNPLFTTSKKPILPMPLAARPIEGLSFSQL